MKYSVVIHKEKDSCFGVTVPDIAGCFSAGDTLEAALSNAKEAIYSHLEILADDGEFAPVPLSVDDHFNNRDFVGGSWAYVDINVSR